MAKHENAGGATGGRGLHAAACTEARCADEPFDGAVAHPRLALIEVMAYASMDCAKPRL